MSAPDEPLVAVLDRARQLGFLGDRPIPEVIEHARSFCDALHDVHGRVLDLGSGGGVPGLVIAGDRPDLELVLLDRRTKRTDFLQLAVHKLRWSDRVEVVPADAEDYLRAAGGSFDAAVARGFGPPRRTLELGLRAVGGRGVVVISEPPDSEPDRWSEEILRRLGARRAGRYGSVAAFRPG